MRFSQTSLLKNRNIINIILIVFAGLIVYSNTFDVPFHFDDNHAIENNHIVQQIDLKKIFARSFRPVLDITLALNYYFGGLDVFGYHLVNIALHIANGIMLYFILLWTINTVSDSDSKNSKVPLYAGLIFVLHPVQTQAVTYIISRSSVLATFFYLLTLLLFIRAFKPGKAGGLFFAGAFLSSCLGMGSKQIAATLPLILLIYDFYFISDGSWKELKSHYKIHMLMFPTALIAVYFSFSAGLKEFVSFDYTGSTKAAEGVIMPIVSKEDPVTSFQYFLTQLHVIVHYIKLLFIPANLNLDYDWPITRNIDLLTAVYFIFLSGLIIAAVLLFKRSKLVSFGIIWFFMTLSVTSSFIVIYDFIFEHRLYLPSVGFAVIMAVVISMISSIGKKS